jgi:hypothetical protein
VYAFKHVKPGEKPTRYAGTGGSEATFYPRKKYLGLGFTDLGRWKQLQDENPEL